MTIFTISVSFSTCRIISSNRRSGKVRSPCQREVDDPNRLMDKNCLLQLRTSSADSDDDDNDNVGDENNCGGRGNGRKYREVCEKQLQMLFHQAYGCVQQFLVLNFDVHVVVVVDDDDDKNMNIEVTSCFCGCSSLGLYQESVTRK